MIAVNNNTIHSFYDKESDDLTVRISSNAGSCSDEVFDDIYLVKDSEEKEIVAFQILFLKKKTDYVLKKYLPEEIYIIVKRIKENIE